MTSDVTRLPPAAEGAWLDFLADRSEALVYHHPAWLRVLRTEGYEALVLGHHDAAGALDGVLPLVARRGWITGRRLVSLPHTPIAGPVAVNREAAAALCGAALEHARELGARFEVKTGTGVLDETCVGMRRIPWSTTFVLELPDDAEDIRFGTGRNHGTIARGVRKVGKEGVKLREGDSEADLRRWYDLYLATMRSHSVPPRPLRFFLALWAGMRPAGLVRLVLAERDGRLLAGSIFLHFGSTIFYGFNGRRADGPSRTNDLIQWHVIHEAVQAGFRRYDLGEVERETPGLAAYKSKWGAVPQPLYRYVDPPLNARSDVRNLERARHLGDAIWRRLPLAATARVGDVVYRRL
jgi:CelD/BcsL family acetyltransferase involved in cellulose biosynthesis